MDKNEIGFHLPSKESRARANPKTRENFAEASKSIMKSKSLIPLRQRTRSLSDSSTLRWDELCVVGASKKFVRSVSCCNATSKMCSSKLGKSFLSKSSIASVSPKASGLNEKGFEKLQEEHKKACTDTKSDVATKTSNNICRCKLCVSSFKLFNDCQAKFETVCSFCSQCRPGANVKGT